MQRHVLEISVPTFNRQHQFSLCLKSIHDALLQLPKQDRKFVGVTVQNNSTRSHAAYRATVDLLAEKLLAAGAGYFNYTITGFDIGAVSNVCTALFNANAEYVWVLPDDDIARLDSIETIVSAIQQFQPCFAAGAWQHKSKIDQDGSDISGDSGARNCVDSVLTDSKKIAAFLSKNVVQLQEYIYKTERLKEFLYDSSNLEMLTPMAPGMLAIYCMQGDEPFVTFKKSIGVYRDGEVNSQWRHLWPRYCICDWPDLAYKMAERGWLSPEETAKAVALYREMIGRFASRPDILLGLSRAVPIPLTKLLKYHPSELVEALLASPEAITLLFFRRAKRFLNSRSVKSRFTRA